MNILSPPPHPKKKNHMVRTKQNKNSDLMYKHQSANVIYHLSLFIWTALFQLSLSNPAGRPGLATRSLSPDWLSIIGLVSGRPTGLQHLLHQVEAHAGLALVLGDGEVVEQVKVAHVGAVGVPVLVHQPFPFSGVSVARADVLGLQVLQLTVDVVAVSHSE